MVSKDDPGIELACFVHEGLNDLSLRTLLCSLPLCPLPFSPLVCTLVHAQSFLVDRVPCVYQDDESEKDACGRARVHHPPAVATGSSAVATLWKETCPIWQRAEPFSGNCLSHAHTLATRTHDLLIMWRAGQGRVGGFCVFASAPAPSPILHKCAPYEGGHDGGVALCAASMTAKSM